MTNAAPRIAREHPNARPLPRRINFTKDAIAGITCPPTKASAAVYDVKAPGLQFIVRRSGARRFYWYGRVKGHARHVKMHIGGEELPIDYVRRRASEALMLARQGVDPCHAVKAAQREATAPRTLADLWSRYCSGFLDSDARPKTKATHASLWAAWLSSWASKPLDTIDGDWLSTMHKTIAKGRIRERAAGKKPGKGKGRMKLGGKRTANKAVSLVRRLFTYSKLAHPVAAGSVELFRQHTRERYLDAVELKQFVDALAADHDDDGRDMLTVLLYTGARRNNVECMSWADVDLDARRWTIPATSAKAGRPIVVPLTDPIMDILTHRKQRAAKLLSPFVFPAKRQSAGGHMVAPRNTFDRVCEAAGIRDLRVHDLRRTLGSWQAAGGASLTVIGKSLGHANQASTAIYARINLDPVRASMTSAVSAMQAAITPKARGRSSRRSKSSTAVASRA